MNKILMFFFLITSFSTQVMSMESNNMELLDYRIKILEKDNQKIERIKQDISELKSVYVDIDFYAILITVIVLIFAIKVSHDAKQEARSVLSEETELLKKEYEKALFEFQQKSDNVLENFMDETDVDIIIKDFNNSSEEIKVIQITSRNKYKFKEYFMLGIFYYKKNDYVEAQECFENALSLVKRDFDRLRCLIFLEKSKSFQNLIKVNEYTYHYDEVISYSKNRELDKKSYKIIYQAYIYKIGRLMILGKLHDALSLTKELLNNYDLEMSYYSRALYTKILLLRKLELTDSGNVDEIEYKRHIVELKKLKLYKDEKLIETIVTRLDTSFRYNQYYEIDIEIIKDIFSDRISFKDKYLYSVAEMFEIFDKIRNDNNVEIIEKSYEDWINTYSSIGFTYNFYTIQKWVLQLNNKKLRIDFLDYISKFNPEYIHAKKL